MLLSRGVAMQGFRADAILDFGVLFLMNRIYISLIGVIKVLLYDATWLCIRFIYIIMTYSIVCIL